MAYQVYLIFEDKSRELEGEFDDLSDAASFALRLADDIGKRPAGDGHGPPKKVDVYRDTQLEISIQIMSGGLLHRRDAPRSRPR